MGMFYAKKIFRYPKIFFNNVGVILCTTYSKVGMIAHAISTKRGERFISVKGVVRAKLERTKCVEVCGSGIGG